MLAEDRYKEILDLLDKDDSVKVSNLIKRFHVSIETIRRDLQYLETEGYLRRVYGGAVLSRTESKSRSFPDRVKVATEEKKQIAAIAMRYVEDGESIALDYGTTTLEVARELKNHFGNLTILTNSMAVASELSAMKGYTIIMTGGVLKPDEYALLGPIAEEMAGKFHVDKAFISATGISQKAGLTDNVLEGIGVQKSFISIADEVIVLCSSEKLESVSLSKICDIDQVNLIITDKGAPDSIYKRYSDAGIHIVFE